MSKGAKDIARTCMKCIDGQLYYALIRAKLYYKFFNRLKVGQITLPRVILAWVNGNGGRQVSFFPFNQPLFKIINCFKILFLLLLLLCDCRENKLNAH